MYERSELLSFINALGVTAEYPATLKQYPCFIFSVSRARGQTVKPGFHMIVRIVPVVSNNVKTIEPIKWKRYSDDRKRPGRPLVEIRAIGTIV